MVRLFSSSSLHEILCFDNCWLSGRRLFWKSYRKYVPGTRVAWRPSSLAMRVECGVDGVAVRPYETRRAWVRSSSRRTDTPRNRCDYWFIGDSERKHKNVEIELLPSATVCWLRWASAKFCCFVIPSMSELLCKEEAQRKIFNKSTTFIHYERFHPPLIWFYYIKIRDILLLNSQNKP